MKYRLAAVAVVVGILLAGGFLGRRVLDDSSGGGWSHQAGDAWNAERTMVRAFDIGVPNLVLLIDPVFAELDAPEVAAAVAAMADELGSHTGITQVETYWSLGGPDSYATEDGSEGLLTARIGGSDAELAERADTVLRGVTYDDTVIEVTVGGSAMIQRDAREASLGSAMPLAIAALMSIGLVLLLLRNPALAGLITLTSVTAVALTMIVLWGVGRLVDFTTLSVLLGVASSWGLATASGFVFGHRFVAERRAGAGRTAAVVATVGSAGRTVAIASTIAAAVLLSLWVMPTVLVRTTAYATAIGVLAAGAVSVLVLGLLLSLFGAGLTTGAGLGPAAVRPGISRWIVSVATARPKITVAVAMVLLGVGSLLGVVGLNTGETSADSLPRSSQSRQVADAIAERFATNEIDAAFVTGANIEFGDAEAQLAEYTATLSSIEGVARADSEEGSFANGSPATVPAEITDRLASDRAKLVRAPLTVDADSPAAQDVIGEVEAVAAPFRADIGGTTARQMATAAAVDARAPFVVVIAAVVILLLAAWLLRGVGAAMRLVVAAVLAAAGAVLVVRLGFVAGWLTSPLGSTPAETLDAVATPMAWAIGLALVAAWLVLAWGSSREAHDVTEGAPESSIRALSATRFTHLGAALLLWLPFLALMLTGWRTQQMITAGVVGAGLLAVTLGRFVLAPALFALSPARLWPRQVDGTVAPVYPHTAAAAWLVGAAEDAPPGGPGSDAAAETVTGAPVWEEIAKTSDLEEWERSGTATVPFIEPARSFVEPEESTVDPKGVSGASAEGADATAEAVAPTRRRRSRWRRADTTSAEEAAAVAGEEVVAEPVAAASVVDEVAEEASGGFAQTPKGAVDETPGEVTEPGIAHDADTPPEFVADTPDRPPADAAPGAVAEVEPDTEPEGSDVETIAGISAEPVAEVEPDTEPEGSDVETITGISAEPVAEVEPDTEPEGPDVETITGVSAEPDAGSEPDDVGVLDGDEAEVAVAAAKPSVAATRPVAAVDVVSLTESVIASIDSDVPFTTEIGSGFVANPSNNLSRVMEAILRDASGRGGEEVLVYGHAAGGRYRWMVVDSGPRADHDPDRARTLAEAQRFIRRVGGVVECRPEGDFTVFVVEIPMAS